MEEEPLLIWVGLGAALLFVSRLMYLSLVLFDRRCPLGILLLQKRPDYKAYTQRVNRFFPGETEKKLAK